MHQTAAIVVPNLQFLWRKLASMNQPVLWHNFSTGAKKLLVHRLSLKEPGSQQGWLETTWLILKWPQRALCLETIKCGWT